MLAPRAIDLSMLILTDRPCDGVGIHDYLTQRGRCEVADVRRSRVQFSHYDLVRLDIDLADAAVARLAAAALAGRDAPTRRPVLLLARSAGPPPAWLGTAEVIHCEAPPPLILAVAERLTHAHPGRRGRLSGPAGADAFALEVKSSLARCLHAARRSEAVPMAELDKAARTVLAAVKQAKIRSWLNVVRQFDDITYQHSLLVAGLVAALALKLGLTPKHQRLLTQAALIHDVGKACVSPDILNKPGALSPSEQGAMRGHATLGYDMLKRQGDIHPVILDVVRHHHEYLDGAGYPDGLKGSQITGFARIVTICDIYAALIERRPYKTPMPPQAALAILTAMGPKLDGDFLRAFREAIADTA